MFIFLYKLNLFFGHSTFGSPFKPSYWYIKNPLIANSYKEVPVHLHTACMGRPFLTFVLPKKHNPKKADRLGLGKRVDQTLQNMVWSGSAVFATPPVVFQHIK